MWEQNLQKESTMKLMEVDRLPDFYQEKLAPTIIQKYSWTNVSALGVAFKPLLNVVQTLSGDGGSGIYFVDTLGKRMQTFKDGSGYLGSLKTAAGSVGGGQARINTIPCDPTMLFMAAALLNIEKKLDDVKELQQDILDYLKAQEKAKLLGNVNALTDIMTNYRYNWNNETYKSNKHILVQDIRRDAEQSLVLCRDQIERLSLRKGHIQSDAAINVKLQKLQSGLQDYQLALYLYSFAAFLEVMLLENFDSQYLQSVTEKIEDYAYKYRELYTETYNHMEVLSQSTVQSSLAKGLARISKGAGSAVAKIPIINKGPVDEAFITAGNKLSQKNEVKTTRALEHLTSSAGIATAFVDTIKTIKTLYNTTEVYLDDENLYLIEVPHDY